MHIQSSTHHFRKKSNGEVEIMFKKESSTKQPRCFSTQFAFSNREIPIYGFDANGMPIYSDLMNHDILLGCMFMFEMFNDEENPIGSFDHYVKYTPSAINDEPIILTSWDDDDYDQPHKKQNWDNSLSPSPQIDMPIAMFHFP